MKYISEADRRAKQMASVFGIEETVSFYLLRWLPRVFTNNPSYQAYVTEGNLVTLSLRYCSRDSPLRLPI